MEKKNKWASRKLFIFLYVSLLFSGFFGMTALQAPSALIVIGTTIIWVIGLFGAAYCSMTLVDKLLDLKGRKKEDQDDQK